MERFIAAAILGLTVVATVSTSASAFQCLAHSSNGVHTWGYGLIFEKGRVCNTPFVVLQRGGIDCHIAFCR